MLILQPHTLDLYFLLQKKSMSKNILFSDTCWRSHLMRETTERKSADELKEDKSNRELR